MRRSKRSGPPPQDSLRRSTRNQDSRSAVTDESDSTSSYPDASAATSQMVPIAHSLTSSSTTFTNPTLTRNTQRVSEPRSGSASSSDCEDHLELAVQAVAKKRLTDTTMAPPTRGSLKRKSSTPAKTKKPKCRKLSSDADGFVWTGTVHPPPPPLPWFNDPLDQEEKEELYTLYQEILIHTIICDNCQLHNRKILYKCSTCTWQVCGNCLVQLRADALWDGPGQEKHRLWANGMEELLAEEPTGTDFKYGNEGDKVKVFKDKSKTHKPRELNALRDEAHENLGMAVVSNEGNHAESSHTNNNIKPKTQGKTGTATNDSSKPMTPSVSSSASSPHDERAHKTALTHLIHKAAANYTLPDPADANSTITLSAEERAFNVNSLRAAINNFTVDETVLLTILLENDWSVFRSKMAWDEARHGESVSTGQLMQNYSDDADTEDAGVEDGEEEDVDDEFLGLKNVVDGPADDETEYDDDMTESDSHVSDSESSETAPPPTGRNLPPSSQLIPTPTQAHSARQTMKTTTTKKSTPSRHPTPAKKPSTTPPARRPTLTKNPSPKKGSTPTKPTTTTPPRPTLLPSTQTSLLTKTITEPDGRVIQIPTSALPVLYPEWAGMGADETWHNFVPAAQQSGYVLPTKRR